MILPRRSEDELRTRYLLEPTLDDIYVEGHSDKRILERALDELSVSRPVYSIDSVEVSARTLAKFGLTSGAKQRVLALSEHLSLPSDSPVRFLVDRDRDEWFNRLRSQNCLRYSRYCDLESHFFREEIVKDLIVGAGRAKLVDWNSVYSFLISVSRQVFAVRMADDELGLQMTFIDIDRFLKKSDEGIEFDLDQFVIRSCHKNGMARMERVMLDCVERWLSTLASSDVRRSLRGHDFLQIVAWLIIKYGGSIHIAKSIDNVLYLLVPRIADELVGSLD